MMCRMFALCHVGAKGVTSPLAASGYPLVGYYQACCGMLVSYGMSEFEFDLARIGTRLFLQIECQLFAVRLWLAKMLGA